MKVNVIVCFVTSERAKQIDAMKEADALQTGLKELAILLDVDFDELSKKCLKMKRISWMEEKYSLGGYAGT